LRLLATRISTGVSHFLGINVIQDGTRLFDAQMAYQYEVAAACSGMRSLTATLALAVILAFVLFKGPGRRAILIAAAIPLAIVANVFRLTTIIIAAEAFGQQTGDWVHSNSVMSMLPYLPAFGGLLLLGHLLREDGPRKEASTGGPAVLEGAEL
jgi:exosortase